MAAHSGSTLTQYTLTAHSDSTLRQHSQTVRPDSTPWQYALAAPPGSTPWQHALTAPSGSTPWQNALTAWMAAGGRAVGDLEVSITCSLSSAMTSSIHSHYRPEACAIYASRWSIQVVSLVNRWLILKEIFLIGVWISIWTESDDVAEKQNEHIWNSKL